MPEIPKVSEHPTLRVWPDAGLLLGYRSKTAAYRAVRSGHIPVVQLSERRWVVPTAALRTMLGLPLEEAGHDARDEA